MRWLVVLMSVMCAASVSASVTETIDLDKRLDKKVTIEVIHTKLADVAAELTKQTGVTIKAGTSVKDWKPRERKVTIQAKDVPAGQLIKEIAHLLDFQVTTNGEENKWAYSFWQDRKSRLAEEEAVTAAEKAENERHKQMRRDALSIGDEALGTSTDGSTSKKTSPLLAYMSGTSSGRALARILSYINNKCPDSRDLFVSGQPITLSLADFPLDIQQAVRDAAEGKLARVAGMWEDEPAKVTGLSLDPPDYLEADLLAGEMTFMGTETVSAVDDNGEPIQQENEYSLGSLPLASSDSALGNLIGEFALELESGRDPDELEAEFEPKVNTPEFAEAFFHRESPTEKNPPTDPELTREIEIKEFSEPEEDSSFDPACGPDEIGLVLKEIARATGWSVLFESFDELNNLMSLVVPGKQPLYKILIALEKAGYLWERGEGTLRIRPDDWLTRRAPEISEALVAQYKRLFDKQGRITLDDLAALVSSLTDTQLVKGLPQTELAGLVDSQVQDPDGQGARGILRLYRSMSPAQKAALIREPGLESGQLTPDQLQRLNAIIADQLKGVIPAYVTMIVDPSMALHGFLISVFEKQGAEPQVIEILLQLPTKYPSEDEETPVEEEQP